MKEKDSPMCQNDLEPFFQIERNKEVPRWIGHGVSLGRARGEQPILKYILRM